LFKWQSKNGFPPIFINQVDKKLYLDCFTQEEKKAGTMLEFMTTRLIESLKAKRKHLLAKDNIKLAPHKKRGRRI
jgi:hypothetical protein